MSNYPDTPDSQFLGDAGAGLFDLKRLGTAFRRRWKLFAVVTALVFGAVLAATLLLTPVWTASAQIKIEPNRRTATDFQAAANGSPPDQALVDTEVGLMRSREVARAVVQKFNLANDPEFIGKGTPKGPPAEVAATALLDKTDVSRLSTTYLVSLSVRSKDPAKAAALANAMAQQYLIDSVSSRVGTATQESQGLNRQLSELGAEVQAADARVAQYRSTAGIVVGGQSGTITEQQVAPLASQLATAEAEAAAANARLAAARGQVASGGLDAVSGVLNSTVIADLRRQRAEVLRKQGDTDARYGPRHPESIALTQQLADLDRQLREEAQRTVRGIESDARASSASAASLRGQLSQLRGQQSSETRASVMAESLERQAEAKRTVYNQLAQATQQRAQQRQNTEASAQIVESAQAPLRPSFPNKPLFAVLGLFLGACAGLSAVVLGESLDVGLRTSADAEKWLRAPFISSVQRVGSATLRELGGPDHAADYVVSAPASEFAEALRTIRRSIPFDDDHKVLAICSSLPNEGKTTVALALARVMAMSGDRVVLVDCDVRKGTLRAVSGAESDESGGLLEVLAGNASLDTVLVADPLTSLQMLPVAKRGFTPRDLFGGPQMETLLAALREKFDRVILDTPPLLAVADARALAAAADSTLLLVRWNATSRFAAQAAASRLRQDGTELSGTVLTMTEKRGGLSRSDPAYYSAAYAEYYRN
jgi:capsular exopolysaccharide synthesis family protein